MSINWTSEDPLFLDVKALVKKTSMGRDVITEAIRSGQLQAKRRTKLDENGNKIPVGKYLVSRQALEEWFDSELESA